MRRQLCLGSPEDQEPELAGVLYSLGAILLDRGRSEEAVEALGEALRLVTRARKRSRNASVIGLGVFEDRYREAVEVVGVQRGR